MGPSVAGCGVSHWVGADRTLRCIDIKTVGRKMNEADFAVWLYGSVARGDADELSDTDVLLISDASDHPIPAVQAVAEASVSHYTWGQITSLAEVGSLFLHHLRLEGRVVAGTPAGVIKS